MDDAQHQQVVEDLANDLLCYRSSFDSTTDPPRRRRRQRPERVWEGPPRAASCNPLDSPLVRSPIGPLVIAHPAQKAHTHAHAALSPQDGGARKHPIDHGIGFKRISKGCSPKISKGGSPQTPGASTGPKSTTSPNHDSLRPPFARKFLWTHKSHSGSPLAHAPRHRRVCVECASRPHSDGKVHHAAADTSAHAIPRSQSEPPPEPAKTLLHWAKRPAAPQLQRANSLQELQVGLARAPSLRNNRLFAHGHLKAVAHALIATFSMSAPKGVTNEDVTMLAWEHTERLALGRRRSGETSPPGPASGETGPASGDDFSPIASETGSVAPVRPVAPPVQRQAARKLLRATSSDALLRGSTSRALSLIRETGFEITNRAEV